MAIYIIFAFVNPNHCFTKSLSKRLLTSFLFISLIIIFAEYLTKDFMRKSRSISNNLSDPFLSPLYMNPHPPNVPIHTQNEAILKSRQRRYALLNNEQKTNVMNLDNREIRSAGSNSYHTCSDGNPDRLNSKSKISSAPSPRSRPCTDPRFNIIKKERSSGLYTFDSFPSLIPENSDISNKPRTKRKENVNSSDRNSFNSTEIPKEPNLPSLIVSKSMMPCKSEASPVTSIPFSLRLPRRSLQQLSKEKQMQLSHKSMQSSLFLSKKLDNLSDSDLVARSSTEIQNEPINLTQYRLPNDLSESFEARVLASLVAQNAHEVNVINHTSTILPHILTSKDFSIKNSEKLTPRTETLLMCGSYSDEESSAPTTGPCNNRPGSFLNLVSNLSDRHGMHNEWKQYITCSQDTTRSIDFISSITDSFCNSALVDDPNGSGTHKVSRYQDYLLVFYIPDFGCFYDPKTGIFYESSL